MDKEERRAWGPLIRAAREAQGLNQEEVAQQANTSRRTLGSIERGDSVAQHDVLDRLLAVLGLAPKRLDDDVEAFMAMVGPLLQMLSIEQRRAVLPEITRLIAAKLSKGRENFGLAANDGEGEQEPGAPESNAP